MSSPIVILGGRGMLGTDLVNSCQNAGLPVEVFDLPEFDITNTDMLTEAVSKASVVINCAAYTNVDGAESQSQLAYKINAEAVGNLGELAKKMGKWVLHISTDFVFDGRNDRLYVETDEPNPISVYGSSKLEGEKLLSRSGCEHCIIRVQWTYGRGGSNFVTKLISRAKETAAVKVVDDQIGSPTATIEVARMICELIEEKPLGLYHFAAAGYVSRFDMAKFVFENLNMNIDLAACKTSDFDSPAQRPLNSRFNCGKIRALLSEDIKQWQVPLKSFLETL
ncbi:MAG: dTDP-4-dehydrorhamnose reductase [Planctomycetota bacterium]|jgi:dTDP-4-dehydrorhamnose reductase